MKSVFRIAHVIGVLVLALMPLKVDAVAVIPDGSGEALILPFFTVNGGNSTVMTVVNEREFPQALKFIFRDDLGETTHQFNAYLESYGSLVMALSEVEGSTSLTIPDQTCTLPALADMDLMTLASTSTGFVEVISMGVFDESAGATFVIAANEQDCDVFEQAWLDDGEFVSDPTAELVAPESGLRATSSVINVTRGTQFAIPATALIDFSDIVQHTDSMFDKPDLTSAHDAGTPDGATTSLNCFARATGCVTAVWASPMDAVAGALIAEAGTGDFTIETEVDAQAEVILTFPLRRHYIRRIEERAGSDPNERFAGDALAFADLGVSIFDRDGQSSHPKPACPPEVGGPPLAPRCGNAYQRNSEDDDAPRAISVFSFNAETEDFQSTIQTPILGISSRVFFPRPQFPGVPSSGSTLFVMMNRLLEERLTSNSGESFAGVPFIAVMIQEVRNETLVDEESNGLVRANYGTSFPFTFSHPDFLRRE